MAINQAKTVATVPCASCGRLNRIDLSRRADRPKCGACKAAIDLARPLPLSDSTFGRIVADSPVPVLVDFYADWCGPCKTMAPLLDQLAADLAGSVLVAKLDTDSNPRSAAQFQIRGIPTLIGFRNGQEYAREVGAVPKGRLEALVSRP